jgi:hypothetical protein
MANAAFFLAAATADLRSRNDTGNSRVRPIHKLLLISNVSPGTQLVRKVERSGGCSIIFRNNRLKLTLDVSKGVKLVSLRNLLTKAEYLSAPVPIFTLGKDRPSSADFTVKSVVTDAGSVQVQR